MLHSQSGSQMTTPDTTWLMQPENLGTLMEIDINTTDLINSGY